MGNSAPKPRTDPGPRRRQCHALPHGPADRRPSVNPDPPRFHPHAKGKNIRLDATLRRATRKNSFCHGLTFSQRPVRPHEQVRLRLTGVHAGWSGALRFGFTSFDPAGLGASEIPKYACPDLAGRPGYWAKALPERLAARGNVLAFWADRHGRVFYAVNGGEPVLFHRGLGVGRPLWAIIDVYGITQEVTLLDSALADSTSCPARLGACSPPSNHDSANYSNNQLENDHAAKMATWPRLPSILGTLTASPSTSPSVSRGTTSDDSDSDLTFSADRSSSASESSLVTAPSSPLGPPVSPFPETPPSGECTVCLDQQVDTVIYTCGHMCLCHGCGLRLKKQVNACCPICRRAIKDVIKTYRP